VSGGPASAPVGADEAIARIDDEAGTALDAGAVAALRLLVRRGIAHVALGESSTHE
jgi:hypothetical protein